MIVFIEAVIAYIVSLIFKYTRKPILGVISIIMIYSGIVINLILMCARYISITIAISDIAILISAYAMVGYSKIYRKMKENLKDVQEELPCDEDER